MAHYNIIDLAHAYYARYVESENEIYGFRRRPGDDIAVPETFEELPRSERDSVKSGLRAVTLLIDPDATFSGLGTDAEIRMSGAPDRGRK